MATIPMKLHHLAAKSFCIRLVYKWATGGMPVMETWKNEDDYGTCPNHDRFIWQMYEMQVPSSIVIPNLIRDQVDYNMWSIVDHVKDWIRYHHSKHFFHDYPASPLGEYIVKLIWKPDRTIDYVATAKNILANGRINAMEKFRFACTYCFVDEITNLRKMANIAKDWNFETDPLLVYWSKYLRNEPRTISPIYYCSSIEVVMLKKALKEYDLWPLIEYFFNKLTKAMKFRKFNDVADHCCKKYLRELLAKMHDKEWNPMFRKSAAKIVLNCAESGDFAQMRRVWRRFKTDINPKNFVSIIEELVPLSMLNYRNFNALPPLLLEIWSSIPDDIKQSAICSDLLQRIGEKCCSILVNDDFEFDFKSRRECIEPLEFFRTLLSDIKDAKKREFFLRTNFYWLILWQPIALVKELLEEFLIDRKCVKKLKDEVKHSAELQKICTILLRYGEFDELNDVVSFCWFHERTNAIVSEENIAFDRETIVFDHENIVFDGKNMVFNGETVLRQKCIALREKYTVFREKYTVLREINLSLQRERIALCEEGSILFKKCVVKCISGMKAINAYLCSYDWRRLYNFLQNYVFPEDDSTTLVSFVIQLIEFQYAESGCFIRKRICRGEMRYVTDFFDAVLPRNSPIPKYECKYWLLLCLFDERESLIFKRSDVETFILWCCDSDEEVPDKTFKQPQLFPKGFLVQLKSCIDEFTFEASDSMEEFLEWCFSSEQEIRQFKRDMIRRYREYASIEDLLKQRRFRRKALNWFFDNDTDLIEKFQVDKLQRNFANLFFLKMEN